MRTVYSEGRTQIVSEYQVKESIGQKGNSYMLGIAFDEHPYYKVVICIIKNHLKKTLQKQNKFCKLIYYVKFRIVK